MINRRWPQSNMREKRAHFENSLVTAFGPGCRMLCASETEHQRPPEIVLVITMYLRQMSLFPEKYENNV
jgi:hypothetical protein